MSYSRPPSNVDDMISLKIDNLTYSTSPNTLRRIFEKYGRVGDVYIPRDRFTKVSRGFAFVRFHDKHHAENAMDALDGNARVGARGFVTTVVPITGAYLDLHLRAHLPPGLRSLHLALMIDLHQPPDPDLLEVPSPSPPRSPDLPQQPRLNLNPEALHQKEIPSPDHNERTLPVFLKRKKCCQSLK
uniref:Serine/arginine-rich splicing factor 2 n=1 Tax=Sus scrofa TaxID=9823 RepID=A0A8D1BTT1_PIG